MYSRQGKNDLAEEQLREALTVNPDLADVHYSLGLLLSERKRYEEAVEHLQKATDGMVDNARAFYNLGQLLAFLHRDRAAETALLRTVEIEPANMNYLLAIAEFYLGRGQFSKARSFAEQMITVDSGNPLGRQLLDFINAKEQ